MAAIAGIVGILVVFFLIRTANNWLFAKGRQRILNRYAERDRRERQRRNP